MIKRQVVLIVSISGIFGIILGVLGMSLVWLQFEDTIPRLGALARTEANIVKNIALLEHLRSGRYADATNQVEAWLDNDLAGAGEYAHDGSEFSLTTLRAMESERKARLLSGYEPDNARVSAKVQAAFRLVPPSESDARIISPLSDAR